jgi:predicted nucleotidyltransferase
MTNFVGIYVAVNRSKRLIKSSDPWRTMVPEEVMDEVKTRLVEKFHPKRIILFGSQARETADDRSDVDLLVICPIKGSRRALVVAMDRVLKGLPVARDILVLTPEEFERDRHIPGTVARPAWKEGRILYEAPGLRNSK